MSFPVEILRSYQPDHYDQTDRYDPRNVIMQPHIRLDDSVRDVVVPFHG